MVSFAHIADVHLGHRQYGLDQRKEDVRASFEDAVNRAIDEGADFVLLAGDLFHSRDVDAETLDVAESQLSRLKDEEIEVIAVEEVENPRRIFFKLLRDHPKIADGLSSEDHDGQYFVANEGETPSTVPCEGTVKVFFDEDGYGFIETEKVEEDVFFLEKDANGETLSGGERIQFDLAESIRRPRALDLEVLERNRKKGIVDWFSEKEGYGFIEPRDRDSDNVFVHKNDVKGGPLSEGEPVEFSVRMESKGPKATAVERIPK
ncbi:hypothetical protein AKJ41_01115 [candidate division MSBL1 archaeon SCGC-AAA259O05]|uniref:CSD domain-containing protein n=1 Tax=candidate division MSBL1 archaeon SCGC-AAA259O05 TaxID=1698271 RepID=A0A133V543_9EURY|nr:hypothetical protein AKJ41_01115 [candidate division MSBL1 archaeon SCGC-AAA259O05]